MIWLPLLFRMIESDGPVIPADKPKLRQVNTIEEFAEDRRLVF